MREETVNRRITNAIDRIEIEELRQFLKEAARFERSKMDKDQPYYKNDYRALTDEYAPEDPAAFDNHDADRIAESAVAESRELPSANTRRDPVQIFSLTLENWRQYGGSQEIDLSSEEGNLINIIEGENGAGKSNLLNSITFCFYGKEVQEQSDSGDLEKLPYVTRSQLDEADPGETVRGYIEVELGVSEPEYLFRREFATQVTDDGEFEDEIGDLELRRKQGNEWERTGNPSSYLNRVLPARVSDYFLFDGEDLDGFFGGGYATRVEEAIMDVSHLELLSRAQYHLSKIRSDIEGEASDNEGEAADIRAEVEQIEDILEQKETQLAEIDDDIDDTKENIQKIDNRLKDVSDEYVKNQYATREDLRERVTELEKERTEVQTDIKEVLVELESTLYSADALLDAHERLAEMNSAESIPPKIQRRFIDELLSRGECICGRSLEEDTQREHLEELRQDVFDVSQAQIDDSARIPTLFETAGDQVERLIERRRTIANIDDEIDEAKSEIQNITDELKAYEIPDDVDISALESNREELENQLEELRNKRARVEVEMEDLERELDELQSELQAELNKQEEYKELRAELSLVDLAQNCLERIEEDILADMREQTESNLQQYFNQLIWKDEEYDVILEDDYSVRVEDPFGDNKIGSLSAGETQVLALSFMAALTRISGFNAPVVIDTPLGRISSTPKGLIAQNLPGYMKNTQITFLMTDEEYTDDVQEKMEDAIAKEYQLVYNDNITRVVPYEEAQEVSL